MFKFLLSVFCLTDLSCCLFCCWFCCWFPCWFPWPWFSCGWFLWCGLPCCSIIYWYCFPSPSATSSSIELFTSFCKSIMALNIMSYLNSSFWSVLSSTGFTFCSDSLLFSIGINFIDNSSVLTAFTSCLKLAIVLKSILVAFFMLTAKRSPKFIFQKFVLLFFFDVPFFNGILHYFL